MARDTSSLRLLNATAFVVGADRLVAAPMLLTIAHSFSVSLTSTAAVAGLYFFAYGALQPVWGMLLDRYGRVPVMRATLVGAGIAGLLSAIAPNVTTLIILRGTTGALFAAAFPAGMTYIGDTVAMATRQREMATLSAIGAVGTAFATVGAGLAASFASWRLAFAVPAVAALVLSILLSRLPEPHRTQPSDHPLSQIVSVLTNKWAVLVMVLGFAEGMVTLGFSTFLAPALQAHGNTAAVAGTVVALYGMAVLAWSRVVRRMVGRIAPQRIIGIGAASMLLGYAIAATMQNVATIGATAICVAAGWSFIHSSFQTWSTDVAPRTRAITVSLFSASVFVGSAVGTSAVATLAAAQSYGELFIIASIATVPLGLVAVFTRAWYAGVEVTHQPATYL